MIRRGLLHCRQYFEIVIRPLIPFICIAPSPTIAIAILSGNQNFAAIAYGTPGPIVARLPDKEAIIPLLIFRSRANQLAAEPESEVRMQESGNRGESSQKTRCGLIGLALLMALASSTFHHLAILFSIVCRQERSSFRFKYGINNFRVTCASPTKLISVG